MKITHPKKTLTDKQALILAEKYVGHSNFMTYGNWFSFSMVKYLGSSAS